MPKYACRPRAFGSSCVNGGRKWRETGQSAGRQQRQARFAACESGTTAALLAQPVSALTSRVLPSRNSCCAAQHTRMASWSTHSTIRMAALVPHRTMQCTRNSTMRPPRRRLRACPAGPAAPGPPRPSQSGWRSTCPCPARVAKKTVKYIRCMPCQLESAFGLMHAACALQCEPPVRLPIHRAWHPRLHMSCASKHPPASLEPNQ